MDCVWVHGRLFTGGFMYQSRIYVKETLSSLESLKYLHAAYYRKINANPCRRRSGLWLSGLCPPVLPGIHVFASSAPAVLLPLGLCIWLFPWPGAARDLAYSLAPSSLSSDATSHPAPIWNAAAPCGIPVPPYLALFSCIMKFVFVYYFFLLLE